MTNPALRDAVKRFSQARPIEFGALLACLLVLGGCQEGQKFERVAVSGYISLDGAPLKSGAIRFIPVGDSGGPAAVATVEEGIYELPVETGPIVGKHRVEIESLGHEGYAIDDENAYAQQVQNGKVVVSPVPETFNRKSQLSVEVQTDGDSVFDFRLTSAGVLADAR